MGPITQHLDMLCILWFLFSFSSHHYQSLHTLHPLISSPSLFQVRQAPEYMLRLQNGKFDEPARMFCDVSSTWNSVYNAPGDVKELIPEFFIPSGDFLLNQHVCVYPFPPISSLFLSPLLDSNFYIFFFFKIRGLILVTILTLGLLWGMLFFLLGLRTQQSLFRLIVMP